MLKTIRSFIHSPEFKTILLLFIIWKILLFLALVFALCVIPLNSSNFLGGGYKLYNLHPYLLPWVNYDGEHYLSIALTGYHSLEQAFFPAYPSLISAFLSPFPNNTFNAALIGLLISNGAFLIGLMFLFKLVQRYFDRKTALGTVITLLVFPTSFYFQAYYTESLFFLSIVMAFYFYTSEKYWLSGFSGIVASATRIFGIVLLPSILAELIVCKKKGYKYLPLLIMPLGLLGYMFYLWYSIGDPFGFYNQQAIFGEHRQKGITLYPQTLFRAARIVFASGIDSHEKIIYIQELIVGVLFFVLPIIAWFKKLPVSLIAFSLLGFLLPTTVGSFSSLPRYVLVLFPSFLMLYLLIAKLPRIIQAIVFVISVSLLLFNTMLFVRGYWVG